MNFSAIIALDKKSKRDLSRQLYEKVRHLILEGTIAHDTALPPSRLLAADLDIARATVVKAYARLKEEGYISTRDGSSTTVNHDLAKTSISLLSEVANLTRLQARRSKLSSYARRLLNSGEQIARPSEPEIAFYGFRGALDLAPTDQIAQSLGYVSRRGERAISYAAAESSGYPPLRKAIADWLGTARGIKCAEDQIVVLAGRRQAIALITKMHIERGDLIALENPTDPTIRQALECEGASLVPIETDQNGLKTELLSDPGQERFNLIFTSPSNQYPSATALSLKRRIALLTWAHHNGALIVEDDQGASFRYTEPAIPALKAIDQQEQVIFLGSFDQTLIPSLSLAYLVVPPNLLDVYLQVADLNGLSAPLIIQAAAADFMQRGMLKRHLRKMLPVYKKRRECLVKALQNKFGNRVTITGEESGLYLVARFDTYLPEQDLSQKALAAGVGLLGTKQCYLNNAPESPEFMLGFADLDESKIIEGIRRLAEIIL